MLCNNLQTLLASLLTASRIAAAQSPTTNTDVVIIGGGSSGTYAAISLLDKGVDVVVVEKQSDLGGHADTYTDPVTGQKVNAGVVVLQNSSIVTEYSARLNVSFRPAEFSTGIVRSAIDFSDGKFLPNPSADPGIRAAFAKYIQTYSANYPYLNNGFYLPNPVPEDLYLSFGDFAKKHQIEPLVYLFNIYTQGWDISKVPAVSALVTINLDVANTILANSFLTTYDVNDLYRSAATILGQKVLYNAGVFLVQRGSSGVTVKVIHNDGIKIIRAKKLLMAAPPTFENLLGWDLTAQELKLFTKLKGYVYNAAIVSNPSFPDNTSILNVFDSNEFKIPPLPAVRSISYTPLPDKKRIVSYVTPIIFPRDLAAAMCVNDLNLMVRKTGYGTGKTKLEAWYTHGPYYLHFPSNDVKNGLYSELYGLQGRKNTYWTGAAFRAQDSTLLWEFTKALIEPISSVL